MINMIKLFQFMLVSYLFSYLHRNTILYMKIHLLRLANEATDIKFKLIC